MISIKSKTEEVTLNGAIPSSQDGLGIQESNLSKGRSDIQGVVDLTFLMKGCTAFHFGDSPVRGDESWIGGRYMILD
jgi:hypothetical protein